MMGRAKNLPDTEALVNEHPKVKENSIYYAKETNDEFLARIKEKTAEVAKECSWEVIRSYKSKNGRTVYIDKKFLYSLDTHHGTFEKLTLNRKHVKEINMDKEVITPGDKAGKYDLKNKETNEEFNK